MVFINQKYNYLAFLSFLTKFIPTPDTARSSFSSAAITSFVVLNPASYKALALLAPTPGSEVKVSIFFFEFTAFDFDFAFVFLFFETVFLFGFEFAFFHFEFFHFERVLVF